MFKSLSNMVKTTLTEATPQDIKHKDGSDFESSLKMAAAKKRWVVDYQAEREKKAEYVRQQVIAQGLDVTELTRKLQTVNEAAKNAIIPSLDDVSMTELTNLVDEMQHEQAQKEENAGGEGEIDSSSNKGNGENGGSGDNSDNQSALALFDKLQAKEDKELDDSVSSVRSSNSFRSMSTRKAKLTVLNQKAYSQIYVADVYQLITSKIGNMVRGQSLMIVLNTYPMGWKVQRLDIDFVQLRHYLIKKYPQVIIPPLPVVNQKKKLSRHQLFKKKVYYQKFMVSVMKSKVLRGCKFLVDFLREQDQYKFGYDLSVKEQARGPRKVKQIKTLTGEILCEASDMAKLFCDGFEGFNTDYQRINRQISKRSKAIETASKRLAHEYFGLSTELDNLQKAVLQKTEIPQFANLYQRISDLVKMTGELSVHQGYMINHTLNCQFKYQREQGRTSFQEAFLLTQGAELKYANSQRILDQQKTKLFKKQDYETWQIQDPALIKEVYKVRNNFEEAKQFMLPEKSQQVQELLDESQYFKQQLFNEVRRTIMLDYFASRDNFLDVGEQYTNHLATNIKEWHKFVNFYSDVNNARKQKDEDYNREQFIGEELDWKMLADNLSLFQSQMGDLKDMQGFDPNQSLAMDATIDMGAPMGDIPNYDQSPNQGFQQNNDFGMNGGIQRSNSLSGQRPDQNNMMGGQQQDQFQRHQTMVPNNMHGGQNQNQNYNNMGNQQQQQPLLQNQNQQYNQNQQMNMGNQQQQYMGNGNQMNNNQQQMNNNQQQPGNNYNQYNQNNQQNDFIPHPSQQQYQQQQQPFVQQQQPQVMQNNNQVQQQQQQQPIVQQQQQQVPQMQQQPPVEAEQNGFDAEQQPLVPAQEIGETANLLPSGEDGAQVQTDNNTQEESNNTEVPENADEEAPLKEDQENNQE